MNAGAGLGGVTGPTGFRAAGVAAGLKGGVYRDVALVVNDGPSQVAAIQTTTNRVVAAPVLWTRRAAANGTAHAVLLNSGGANACTGEAGYADAERCAEHAAEVLTNADPRKVAAPQAVRPADVLVCSTGLIGERLPMPKLLAGITDAVVHLDRSEQASLDAAHAIMTTDSVPKMAHFPAAAGWSIGGMAKGAGMLAPSLATMLCVLTTDAVLEPAFAQAALAEATSRTFDRVDSDGCLSTNDTVLLLASGASGVRPKSADFEAALAGVCGDLARALVADAEGATHDIAITVRGADSIPAALAVGRAIARSNLFKAAIYGNDPNWGRVLAAVGTVPPEVAPFDANRLDVTINGVRVCQAGTIGEHRDRVTFPDREVSVVVHLNAGSQEATIWTNDLTHDYVLENSAYST